MPLVVGPVPSRVDPPPRRASPALFYHSPPAKFRHWFCTGSSHSSIAGGGGRLLVGGNLPLGRPAAEVRGLPSTTELVATAAEVVRTGRRLHASTQELPVTFHKLLPGRLNLLSRHELSLTPAPRVNSPNGRL